METAPLRYLAPPGRYAIIDALAPIVQSWFADTLSEPIPEELAAIIQRIDVQSFADDREEVHRKDAKADMVILDHFVGEDKQSGRHFDTERPCNFGI